MVFKLPTYKTVLNGISLESFSVTLHDTSLFSLLNYHHMDYTLVSPLQGEDGNQAIVVLASGPCSPFQPAGKVDRPSLVCPAFSGAFWGALNSVESPGYDASPSQSRFPILALRVYDECTRHKHIRLSEQFFVCFGGIT